MLLLILAGAVALFYVLGMRDTMQRVILWLRDVGPLLFFLAMAILPSFGFPLIPFTVAAGPVFGPTLGPALVVALSIAALICNLALSYWLAGLLRPQALRFVRFLGYEIPELRQNTAWQLVALVRLTPGPPFWVQSYILGLLRVAFLPYLAMSTLVVSGYIVGLVYGGDAISQGHGKTALIALGLIGALAAAIHLYRKRYMKEKT